MNSAEATTPAKAGERRSRARTEPPISVPSADEFEQTVLEAVNIAVALELILEAGDQALEMDEDEVRAALRIAAQLVTLTKQVRKDVRAFFKADVLKIGMGVST